VLPTARQLLGLPDDRLVHHSSHSTQSFRKLLEQFIVGEVFVGVGTLLIGKLDQLSVVVALGAVGVAPGAVCLPAARQPWPPSP
jgi:hypothetical protein